MRPSFPIVPVDPILFIALLKLAVGRKVCYYIILSRLKPNHRFSDRSSDVDLWKMCCKDECTDLDIKESLCKYASQGYGVKFEEEAEEIDMVSFAAEGFKKSCGHDIVVKTVNVPTKISLKQCARTRGWRRRRPRRIPDKFNRVQNYACINCVKIK